MTTFSCLVGVSARLVSTAKLIQPTVSRMAAWRLDSVGNTSTSSMGGLSVNDAGGAAPTDRASAKSCSTQQRDPGSMAGRVSTTRPGCETRKHANAKPKMVVSWVGGAYLAHDAGHGPVCRVAEAKVEHDNHAVRTGQEIHALIHAVAILYWLGCGSRPKGTVDGTVGWVRRRCAERCLTYAFNGAPAMAHRRCAIR